ncbi:MAG TPA: type II toxin-antitoxin system VapB family antitoxin [Novosphingobium sp.]
MRTTVTLDAELVTHLQKVTGIRGTSALLHKALIELRQREAARRLIALGGSDPNAWAPNEGDEPIQ